MTLYLGIDIGLSGALAVLDGDGALISIDDMPCLKDGPAGRRAINAPLLASIIFKSHAHQAFVEHVSARPREGPTGAFAFGRARGVIEGALAAAGVPCTFLTPATWKRAVNLRLATKDAARSEAIRRLDRSAWLIYLTVFRRCSEIDATVPSTMI
jgi:crossover junction endodeoxyribonuclease RuvC